MERTSPFDAKEKARNAVIASAWHEVREDGSSRKIVHCFRGGIGADWELSHVLDLIDRSDRVQWVHGFAGHNLAIESENHTYYFQAKRT